VDPLGEINGSVMFALPSFLCPTFLVVLPLHLPEAVLNTLGVLTNLFLIRDQGRGAGSAGLPASIRFWRIVFDFYLEIVIPRSG
jgi:hypothetical protein